MEIPDVFAKLFPYYIATLQLTGAHSNFMPYDLVFIIYDHKQYDFTAISIHHKCCLVRHSHWYIQFQFDVLKLRSNRPHEIVKLSRSPTKMRGKRP
jgi:hypothetical protein